MLTLHQLQTLFIDGIYLNDVEILRHIKPSSSLSAKAQLDIYQSSMTAALQKVLQDIYAVCNKLVGQDFFIAMINIYIEKNHSYSPNIGDYGADLADFIDNFQPAKSLPYLSDVARLEWAWHKTYDARYSTGIDFEKLAACYQTDPEKIIFSLPPDSFLLTSPYPIHTIWKVNQDDYVGDPTILLKDNERYYFLIWRKQEEMRLDLVNEKEWSILNLLKAGYNLGNVYQKVSTLLSDTEFAAMLPELVKHGWLAECKIATENIENYR